MPTQWHWTRSFLPVHSLIIEETIPIAVAAAEVTCSGSTSTTLRAWRLLRWWFLWRAFCFVGFVTALYVFGKFYHHRIRWSGLIKDLLNIFSNTVTCLSVLDPFLTEHLEVLTKLGDYGEYSGSELEATCSRPLFLPVIFNIIFLNIIFINNSSNCFFFNNDKFPNSSSLFCFLNWFLTFMVLKITFS